MQTPQIYILISIVTLAIILLVLILMRKKMQKPLSLLGGLAFVFVITGVMFSESRLVGYGLIGVGVILAAIDIMKKIGEEKVKSN